MAAGDAAPLLELDAEDEDVDETLSERLLGLTEMFPESLRNAVGNVCSTGLSASKGAWSYAKNGAWIFSSSFIIAVLPVLLEYERVDMEQRQMTQQRQFLLGTTPQGAGQSTYGAMMAQKMN